jgi:hypothetical protein
MDPEKSGSGQLRIRNEFEVELLFKTVHGNLPVKEA